MIGDERRANATVTDTPGAPAFLEPARIIRRWLEGRYRFTHRQRLRLWSATERRWVRRSEAGPTSELLDRLAGAREGVGKTRSQLLRWYRLWAPTAWADIWTSLPAAEGRPGKTPRPGQGG
jgi:hypothetical protein